MHRYKLSKKHRDSFVCRSAKYIALANDYIASPEKYLRTFTIRINGKLRKIITYTADENGYALRNFHYQFSYYIRSHYKSSPNSYAYQAGKNIEQCLKQHLRSDLFLKSDIHAFFDTIDFEKMIKRLCRRGEMRANKETLGVFLKTCFYDSKMPIGFITSPILSDLFLVYLDRKMSKIDGIVYTRYADDFIISTDSTSIEPAEEVISGAKNVLLEQLKKCGLSVNAKKTYTRRLKCEGDSIHVLGLNIVKTTSETNRVTVSGNYLRELCKELCEFINSCAEKTCDEIKTDLPSVYGRLAFVLANSEDSMRKFEKMFAIKFGCSIPLDYKSLLSYCIERIKD